MPPASRHRGHLHWEARGSGMGKQEAPIILAGSVRGTGNFLPVVGGGFFWKECFVFASDPAGIDRAAVPCITLLNI